MSLITEWAPPNDGSPAVCVWQCLSHDDGFTRTYNKQGERIAIKKGCGRYNILTTRRRNGDRENQWQNKCKCGKRSHLNAARIVWFPSRLDAAIYVEERNK